MKPLIGIIGGTGMMGRWFKKFFNRQSYKVLIAGRKTKLTPQQLAKKCDIVIISVPISATVKTINEISKYVRKDALLMDLTSIKVQPVKAMLKSKSEVIGAHPVFGPSTKTIKDQTMVLCPARGKKWLPWVKKLFKKNKAKIKITTPKKHDSIMAVIQGIMHFSSLSIVMTMKKSGFKIEEILDFTSPVFKLEFDIVGRILNQDPKLYADIEILNQESIVYISKMMSSSEELKKIIKKKNKKQFEKFFNDSARFLGKYRKEAMEESDYLIEKMVEAR